MILIIGGTGKWETANRLISKYNFEEVHAFEANRDLPQLNFNSNIHFYNVAISTKDSKEKFYTSENYQASTLNINKITGNISEEKYNIVETINFPEWIIKNFTKKNIYLDMDIEGNEYDVLNRMIENKSILLIEKLVVEFHWKKVKNISKDIHDKLIKRLKSLGINLSEPE